MMVDTKLKVNLTVEPAMAENSFRVKGDITVDTGKRLGELLEQAEGSLPELLATVARLIKILNGDTDANSSDDESDTDSADDFID